MIFLLLVALVVLGPEKLPEAVRKFIKTYAEFKKTVGGFQTEFRDAMDEPMRELRETANAVRDAAKFDIDGTDASAMEKVTPPVNEIAPKPEPTVRREAGLNFGSANPRRQDRVARADADPDAGPDPDADPAMTETVTEPEAVAVEPAVSSPAPTTDAAPTEDATE